MNTRNQSLDVIRGIAVLLVILCHYPLYPFMAAGGFGVDLFFVLSGFLISGLLFSDLRQNGSLRLGRFFFRRGMKIYPPLFFLLGTTALFALRHGSRSEWLSEALFLQSYRAHIWDHTWSLAVEEHFYILLPLLLIGLVKLNRLQWIPRIAIAMIVVCFVARIATTAFNPQLVMYSTHDRLDELFAGVALGYIYSFDRERFALLSRWWTLPLGLVLLLPAVLLPQRTVIQVSPTLALNAVGFALVLLWAVPRRIWRLTWIAPIGRYSYSIYLWHYPLCLLWKHRPLTALGLASYMAASILIGVGMSLIAESPFLSLRESMTRKAARVSAEDQDHLMAMS